MITRIEISQYRSCLHTTFDLQPHLSVLIGPNGSGKTNLLSALLLLQKLTEEQRFLYRPREEPTGECRLKAWFDLGGKRAILTATVNIYADEHNNEVVVNSRQQWYLKDFTGTGKRVWFPLEEALSLTRPPHHKYHEDAFIYKRIRLRNTSETAIKPLTTIAEALSEMRYYSASQFTNPAQCPVSLEIEQEGRRNRAMRLSRHAKFLFDLYSGFKAQSRAYQQFLEIVGPDGIGLVDQVDFQEIKISSMDYTVVAGGRTREIKRDKILAIPQFTIGKHNLSPNQLSEGTFKTIAMIFYLVTEASSVLLIEEPEVCVHHGLLSSIIELIKTYSREKQIVISTHSDFVLDHVLPENVYTVSNSREEGTTVAHIPKSMSRQDFAALKDYMDKEGNLGEYWKHGALE